MNFLRNILFVVLAALLSACAGNPPLANMADQRPAWVDNPGDGVSASAGMHIRGRAAQEELAISRARVEYAKRFGVSIDAGQVTATSVANGQASTVGRSVATEETRQNDVKAVVKAKWRDEAADVLWVWLVPSN